MIRKPNIKSLVEQRQQNIICIMEELKKHLKKKEKKRKWSIGPSCNGKRIMGVWVCCLLLFRAEQIHSIVWQCIDSLQEVFLLLTHLTVHEVLLLDGLCNGLLLQKPTD